MGSGLDTRGYVTQTASKATCSLIAGKMLALIFVLEPQRQRTSSADSETLIQSVGQMWGGTHQSLPHPHRQQPCFCVLELGEESEKDD